jgi:hypothetical protein
LATDEVAAAEAEGVVDAGFVGCEEILKGFGVGGVEVFPDDVVGIFWGFVSVVLERETIVSLLIFM